MHGRWPAVHLGALEAAYGATPFYAHLRPGLERILRSAEAGSRFATLTERLHCMSLMLLEVEALLPELRRMYACNPERLHRLAEEKAPDCTRIWHLSTLYSEKAAKRSSHCSPMITTTLLHTDSHMPANQSHPRIFCCRRGRGRFFLHGMCRALLLAVIVVACCATARGDAPDLPELKVKAYLGFQRFVDEYGDTCRMTYIREVVVYPPMKFKNKKEEEFYWRTVRDVRKTLPLAKLCYTTLCETYEYIQTIPDKKKREAHLKRLESEIFEQYKPVMKTMTKNQGKTLLKLINRETDQSSFNIVKAFLGSFRAGFWQTFGRFFGMNLKAGFHPDKNREDAIIDRVATLIEQGAL